MLNAYKLQKYVKYRNVSNVFGSANSVPPQAIPMIGNTRGADHPMRLNVKKALLIYVPNTCTSAMYIVTASKIIQVS